MRTPWATALPLLVALAALVSGCSQFTTSDAEAAELKRLAEQAADGYLGCIKSEALLYVDSNTEPDFIVDAVRSRCSGALDTYKSAEETYLETQVMMTDKPLEKSVAKLQQRARSLVAEEAVRVGSAPLAKAAATAAATAAPVKSSGSAQQVSAVPAEWSPAQRIYLDCMLDQGKRYANVQESAEVIAEVAANRCRTYLTTENAAALLQEGRGLVLGTVLDAKVAPQRR